jgi:hypothetical protein
VALGAHSRVNASIGTMETGDQRDAPVDGNASQGRPAPFRAFTAQDWARVEKISPAYRAVGRMMRESAGALLAGVDKWEAAGPFELVAWRTLSGRGGSAPASSHACSQEEAPPKGRVTDKRSKKSGPKATAPKKAHLIRLAGKEKLLNADMERVAGAAATLPRAEAFGGRLEPYLAAVEMWAREATRTASLVNRSVSLSRCVAFAAHKISLPEEREEVCAALRATMASLLGDRTFAQMLDAVVEEEETLVTPAFAGEHELHLYPEQEEVAASLLDALRRRKDAKLARCCIPGGPTGPSSAPQVPTSPDPSFILRYATPPSSGKSSGAALLGCIFEGCHAELKSQAPREARIRPSFIVYSCYSNAVRLDVAKACVACALPYAIMSEYVAVPSYSCYTGRAPKKEAPPPDMDGRLEQSLQRMIACDRPPQFVICDTASATAFLKFTEATATAWSDGAAPGLRIHLGDVLLLDEPTVGVEDRAPPSTGASARAPSAQMLGCCASTDIVTLHCALLRSAPPLTVMMSATLPIFEDLEGVVAHLRLRHGSRTACVNVECSRISSPCTALDGAGRVYAPHRVVTGGVDRLLDILKHNSHVARFYSPRAVCQLLGDIQAVRDAGHLAAAPRVVVSPVWACDFSSIRAGALELLSALPPWFDLAAGVGELAYPEASAPFVEPDAACMCKEGAASYPGTSIVLGEVDDAFVSSALPPLLLDCDVSLRRLIKEYTGREKRRSEAQDRATVEHERGGVGEEGHRDDADCAGSSRGGGGDRRGSSRLDRERECSALATDETDSFWPAHLCVNTAAHARRYKTGLHRALCKTAPVVEVDVASTSHEGLVEALLCGAPLLESENADSCYRIAVQEMADRAVFSFVSGGRGTIYGVNLPSSRVVVLLDAERCTSSLLKQAVGRAGRTGKCVRSEAVFGSWALLAKAFCEREDGDAIAHATSLDLHFRALSVQASADVPAQSAKSRPRR